MTLSIFCRVCERRRTVSVEKGRNVHPDRVVMPVDSTAALPLIPRRFGSVASEHTGHRRSVCFATLRGLA